jgi:tetratricopeptide (TPR) repeat protein
VFLKKFLPLLQSSVFKYLSVKYVMTDISPQLIEYWQRHPSLQPFIAQGVLDFAFFDAEQPPHQIKLIISGGSLDPQSATHPLIVLANYFFDSIPQDIFEVKDGRLYEKLVSVSVGANNNLDPEELEGLESNSLDQFELSYEARSIRPHFYREAAWDTLLEYYRQTLADTNFLFPNTALRCIKYLQQLSNNQMLLLSADKGFIELKDLLDQAEPEIAFHGSISLMVNYHAIGQYFLNANGQYLRPDQPHKILNVCGFIPGDPLAQSDWLETSLAYREVLENNNPSDFFYLKKGLEQFYEYLSLEQLLAYLRISGWDSNIFMGCLPVLLEQVKRASPALKKDLVLAAAKIWDNYYPLGEAKDIAFSLGLLLFGLEQYEMALEYFGHSLQIYGREGATLYNIGMCYNNLGRVKEAQIYLAEARLPEPNSG